MNELNMRKNCGITYFSIPAFEETGLVISCFASRIGGVSKKPYSSLNLGVKTADSRANIQKNYELLFKAINIPIENSVLSDQVHKDNIKIITTADRGKGIIRDSNIFEVDGMITNEKGIALVTHYADCVPIYLLDPVNKVIGLVHAGWKGTVLRIAQKAILKMQESFGTEPKNCLAAIGPSIGKCCYEVDEPVINKFNQNFTNLSKYVFFKENNRYNLDLWEANKNQLEEIGILQRNIIISNLCTHCNNHLFFSHRSEEGITGRMAAVLQLK
ncbi:peptidoglycan editing factor PgeF [Geosporobacter ferrireducens]|uniref:Purine nucleoside phosphorylase n=1 Tax=Geosporobacter ferrireducens TaxID=1424294 RepID=A0A1D8GC58_9FIRM|nr:peptidoglycan editing factor PgeF [Geosporobacter ferrireducens]AOT68450.1 polyphenol oxidase [Geosporobacter ferrireducens]MTI53908.1 peptidoglycan editing factor PgeF [Geosporobacter ferrireducens]